MPGQLSQNLLTTKMFRPPLPADCVRRADLLGLLEDGRSRPLTLVSAPAGYGKSMLVSGWLEATDWSSVWLSLDEGDSSLQRFLGYLTEAVCERFPGALETTKSLSRASQFPGTDAVAAIVSNELNAIDRPFLLVLDDYHRVHATSAVHDVIRFLLQHPPIPLHLVILTRRDPPLPLGRLRGLGQVTEVRMQDLQFGASETKGLLERVTDVPVTEDAVANVERELEGWAAGLRLMTLALRGTEDPETFLRGFRGGTRQMQQYLASEVIAGLSKPLRAWLLRSALLDRFCAPLCEAVCRTEGDPEAEALDGQAFLEQIQFANLFLVPLDGYGHWFRFHHLFQRLLQTEESRHMDEDAIAMFHMRAGAWFEANGFIEDALKASLRAGDQESAARILERHRLDELEKLNWPIVERWLEILGPQATPRPGLQLAAAFGAVRRFDVRRLAAILDEVAPEIEDNPDFASLLGELKCLQGIRHYRMGDGEASIVALQEARRHFEGTEKRGIAGFAVTHEILSLGLCGQGAQGRAYYDDLASNTVNADALYRSLLLAGYVGLSYLQGDLTETANGAVRLQSVSEESGAEFPIGLSLFFQTSSELQRGEFETALALSDAVAQRRFAMPLRIAFGAMAALALSRQLLGQNDAAARAVQDLLTLAQQHNEADGLETARACQARIRLMQGDLDAAAKWAGVTGAPPNFAGLFLSVEVPAITRARIWIAQGTRESLRRALDLMTETRNRAQHWHLTSQIIEADVLNSLALAGLGKRDDALECLAETVDLAAPGGWIRLFLEPGKAMGDLLAELKRHGRATDYSERLRAEIETSLGQMGDRPALLAGATANHADVLRNSLTNRELVILDLLGNRLQNKEIAKELSVSPETVKTHLKNLFSKLGVKSRREARPVEGHRCRRTAAQSVCSRFPVN